MKITTFLMFSGSAEEAMTLYLSLFPGSKLVSITRYGANEAGKEGTVQHAIFELCGEQLMCIDSPAQHAFTFTPAMSLFVTCAVEAELQKLFAALSEDGQILMPLDNYGFSTKFAWVQDRFGVSWQLNLP